ncbi:MAG TPA: MlaD family protein [Bryobacteraceae bacterium]|nr:MlaD family protein [Bryobacteraceae bacterium]
MAIQTKARWARLRAGILAIAAMVILAVLIFLITGKTNIFQSQTMIYTYMADAAALAPGAPVNVNGIPIGKVKRITLSGEKNPQRLVRIEMQVPEEQLKNIPADSLAEISAANVLGTKYINIKSGISTVTVKPGGEIPSVNTGEIQDLVQQGFGVLNSLQDTVKEANKLIQHVDEIVGLVESGKGSIGKLLTDDTLYNHFLAIVDEVKQLADVLNSDRGTLGKLLYDRELYDDVQRTVSKVDQILDGLQQGQGTAGKLLKDPAIADELQKTVADVHKIVQGLNEGQGTAGKLLKSDELHKELADSLSKLDLIMDKVNSGQGTLGQLLVNPALYDNLSGATREMHGLMQDFRANPKKFLRIKLAIF